MSNILNKAVTTEGTVNKNSNGVFIPKQWLIYFAIAVLALIAIVQFAPNLMAQKANTDSSAENSAPIPGAKEAVAAAGAIVPSSAAQVPTGTATPSPDDSDCAIWNLEKTICVVTKKQMYKEEAPLSESQSRGHNQLKSDWTTDELSVEKIKPATQKKVYDDDRIEIWMRFYPYGTGGLAINVRNLDTVSRKIILTLIDLDPEKKYYDFGGRAELSREITVKPDHLDYAITNLPHISTVKNFQIKVQYT